MKGITKKNQVSIFLTWLTLIILPNQAFALKSWFCGTDGDTGQPVECVGGYPKWIQKVWEFSFKLAVPVSVLMLAVAGVFWITSGGDPKRLGIAKKMIIGVVSGVGLLLLSGLLIITLFGPNAWNKGYVDFK